MSKKPKIPPRLPWSEEPLDSIERITLREERTEMQTLGRLLEGLPPERQISLLAELDTGSFRILLDYYRPTGWVLDRVIGRRRRLGYS